MRTIEYYDWVLDIEDFEDCHRMANQTEFAGGFAVNPCQRPDFDNTPNEIRETAELDDWWDRPYILAEASDKFTVRCLDGGAHDRSTWIDESTTLEGAVHAAKQRVQQLPITDRPDLNNY